MRHFLLKSSLLERSHRYSNGFVLWYIVRCSSRWQLLKKKSKSRRLRTTPALRMYGRTKSINGRTDSITFFPYRWLIYKAISAYYYFGLFLKVTDYIGIIIENDENMSYCIDLLMHSVSLSTNNKFLPKYTIPKYLHANYGHHLQSTIQPAKL